MRKNKTAENQIARVDNRVLESFLKDNDALAFKVLMYIGKSGLNKHVDINTLKDDELYEIPIDLPKMRNYYNLTAREIKRGVEKLNKTSINYRRIEEDGSDVETFVNVLPKAKINYTKGTFDCKVFGEVLKLIYAIRRYSKVNVKNFIQIEKKHSPRMLLLLERIANYKKVEVYTDPKTLKQTEIDVMPKRQHFDLDELNKMFGTKYPTYSLFIKRVLEPTKEDLDMNSTLSFEYTAVKDRIGEKAKSRGRTPIVKITIDVIENKNLFTV